jgi:hypothetical protein
MRGKGHISMAYYIIFAAAYNGTAVLLVGKFCHQSLAFSRFMVLSR